MKRCPSCGMFRPVTQFLAWQCDRCDGIGIELSEDRSWSGNASLAEQESTNGKKGW